MGTEEVGGVGGATEAAVVGGVAWTDAVALAARAVADLEEVEEGEGGEVEGRTADGFWDRPWPLLPGI